MTHGANGVTALLGERDRETLDPNFQEPGPDVSKVSQLLFGTQITSLALRVGKKYKKWLQVEAHLSGGGTKIPQNI